MFGFVATPPRPRAGLASLEPYDPVSGTTGVSPTTRRRARRTLAFNHNHNSPPAVRGGGTSSLTHTQGTSGQSPAERLRELTAQIEAVLKAYATQPMKSLVYLAHLKEFYRRAIELDPNASARLGEHEDPADAICAQSQLTIPPPYGARAKRPSIPNVLASMSLLPLPRRMNLGAGPNVLDVDKLESDWWSSEVVAVWYGPRPGNRNVAASCAGGKSGGRRESAESGMSGGSGLSEKYDEFDGRQERTGEQREQGGIKRDGSFVGLYDDGTGP